MLDGSRGPIPFELVNDGDLLLLIERVLHRRGLDTVRISKVKGHADEDMVLHGRVRREDKFGNDAADEAADFGRRRVGPAVIDARRNLSGVCGRWYPIILDLHRFFIAISRAVVIHDGLDGSAPDPLVWSAGALHKRRRLVHAVRDRAFLSGPPGIWHSEWFQIPAAVVCVEDVALWPYTPGLLVKWVSFLNSLHWPIGDLDLGVGGVSYVELLILYELWAGERLSLKKSHPRYLRPGHPISVSGVPFGPGIDIWRSCRFIGAVMRALCLLPGGLRRFVNCSIGANHCRLRHIGWEKCGHGLTSRPRESASDFFLDELLSLFILLGLVVLCLMALFLCGIVLFVLLVALRLGAVAASGQVSRLVAAYPDSAGDCSGEVFVLRVPLVSKSSPVRKRFRLNRKTPAHLAGLLIHSRPHVWKRLRQLGFSGISMPDHTRRRCDHAYGSSVPEHDRIGVG